MRNFTERVHVLKANMNHIIHQKRKTLQLEFELLCFVKVIVFCKTQNLTSLRENMGEVVGESI
jgi:hypothetical protein